MAEPRPVGRSPRILVVGCGSIGRRHIGNLLALGQRELCIVDPDPEALARLERECGVRGHTELDAGLAWGPEAVVVANPTSLHVETAIAAARRGCHLFIEKPLSDRLEGLDELVSLSEQQRLVTLVGCNMRFHPGPRLVSETLTAGVVGGLLGARLEVGSYLPSWRPGTAYQQSYSAQARLGGGCVLDAIHELDLACWLFGFPQEVTAVTRVGKSLGIGTEALAEILLGYASGLVVSVHVDYVQRWRQRRCEIIGEAGTVAWEARAGAVWVAAGEPAVLRQLGFPRDYDINEMYREELAHFLRCLDGQEQPCADAAWAARVTRLALAVKDAAAQGRTVPLTWETESSRIR